MGWVFIVLLLTSCVDEKGNPIPLEFYSSDDECLVSEHYKSNDVYFSICHLKNRSVYDSDIPEKVIEF